MLRGEYGHRIREIHGAERGEESGPCDEGRVGPVEGCDGTRHVLALSFRGHCQCTVGANSLNSFTPSFSSLANIFSVALSVSVCVVGDWTKIPNKESIYFLSSVSSLKTTGLYLIWVWIWISKNTPTFVLLCCSYWPSQNLFSFFAFGILILLFVFWVFIWFDLFMFCSYLIIWVLVVQNYNFSFFKSKHLHIIAQSNLFLNHIESSLSYNVWLDFSIF